MRKFIKIVVFYSITLVTLFGQSKTLEITPDFHEAKNGFSTLEIPFSAGDEKLDFISVSCYHFDTEDVGISYRIKTNNQWSAWIAFEQLHEYVAPDRIAYQTKAIDHSFSTIQLKSSKKIMSPLTLRFFIAKKGDAPSQTIDRSISCESLETCERDCWCPTCPIDNTPQITNPTHLIVHHSAGNNQSNNFAAVVESIWDLHVNTNGWDDIGYNWLIDPNGILYQGRLDNYQGAHFSCINENTVGTCIIGDYSLVEPTEASLNTLVNLLAFEATEHHIDVTGASYHVTGDFVLNNIAGHRDSSGSTNACSGTVCPGDSFYPLLPDIRMAVSELPCYQDGFTSTKENEFSNIHVFPNPVQTHIKIETIDHQLLRFEIVDMNGKILGFVDSGKANDISYLSPGIYFIIHEGKYVQRVIKK